MSVAETPSESGRKVQRHGWVLGIRPDAIEEYKRLHAEAWPGVLARIKECHIENYSIYLHQLDDGNWYLFSYLEYTGDDFAADMAKMGEDPTTQQWWSVIAPMQIPVKHRKEGEHWATMEEVFHCP